jgi:hypothetical protein
MRIRTPLLAAAAAATMLAGAALPASAADTATTFTLTGGGLAITPQIAAVLDTTGLSTTVGAHDVVGSLGAVTVDDTRGVGNAGWTVSATSSAFDLNTPILVPPLTGTSITSSTNVSYAHGTFSAVDGVTTTGSPSSAVLPLTPATAATVVTGTLAIGTNTATWTPNLTVSMPATARAGEYSGTVTTSVA